MTAFLAGLVDVRLLPGGAVAVGRVRPLDVLHSPVRLAGATLTVDLDRLDAVPALVVADVTSASWWVAHVLGEEVAVAILAAADGENTRVRAVPGELAAPVLRFAVGRWLHRWWPAGRQDLEDLGAENDRWLETELGILAWWADQAFGGPDTAADLLAPNVEHVERFARWTADRTRPVAALRAVIECVALDDERYARLDTMERALTEEVGVVAGSDLDSELRRLAGQTGADRYELVSLRAALGALPGRDGSAVDWARVPPRVVSGADDAVRWAIEFADGTRVARVSVSVPIGPRWDGDQVFAAVHRNGADFPEVTVELAPMPGSTDLVGTAPVAPVEDGDVFRVEIFAERWLDVDEPSLARQDDRQRVVDRIGALLLGRGDVDPDLAPYDLEPGAWPVPPARTTWGRS